MAALVSARDVIEETHGTSQGGYVIKTEMMLDKMGAPGIVSLDSNNHSDVAPPPRYSQNFPGEPLQSQQVY